MLLVCTHMLLVYTRVLLVCSYMLLVCYSCVVVCARMLLVFSCMLLVCTRMLLVCTRMSLVGTHMLLVCYSCVLVWCFGRDRCEENTTKISKSKLKISVYGMVWYGILYLNQGTR